jgi:hypothetical protein
MDLLDEECILRFRREARAAHDLKLAEMAKHG